MSTLVDMGHDDDLRGEDTSTSAGLEATARRFERHAALLDKLGARHAAAIARRHAEDALAASQELRKGAPPAPL